MSDCLCPTSFDSAVSLRRSDSGFTLIELLVAASLMGIVLAAGATLTAQVGRARTSADRLAAHHAEADAALRAITVALNQQFRNTAEDARLFVGTDEEFDGRPSDRLRFFTVSQRMIRADQPESDVHEVEFYLEPQEGEPYPALLCRTDPTRNEYPDGGGVIELIARRVAALDFEYFDGQQWTPDWPEFLEASPAAVRVTFGVILNEQTAAMQPYRRLIYFPMMPTPGNEQSGEVTPLSDDAPPAANFGGDSEGNQ